MNFPKHFDGKRFYNPGGAQARGLLDVLRWKLASRAARSAKFVSDVKETVPPERVADGGIRVTLINHSTVLLQHSGLNILTDPVWSERVSPFAWVGPRRHRKPGVRQEDLPHIDLVLLSHNHYDHLDLTTLHWLMGRGVGEFIVPLGVERLLREEKIGPVRELDWGDEQAVGAARICAVPALHFSARGAFDRNKTLWCGYVITTQDKTVYFAADTAFGEHFSQIRERFGRPHLSLLPIGAYQPRWFMSAVHMGPEEAVKAHEILGSETSVAIHHGTFQLADDGLDEAPEELLRAGRPETFFVLKNGEWVGLG